MKKSNIILIVILLLALSITYASEQNFIVIVNNANLTTSLTKEQVLKYFLKKRSRWSDDTEILPVDLSPKSSVRIKFTEAILEKSVSQVRAYWQQSVFSGKASPPLELNNDIEVINYVKTHKGAIGYISSKSDLSEVKILTIK